MRLVRLAFDTPLADFDCGDEDLNDFLVEDAKGFLNKRIANSFILEDEGRKNGFVKLTQKEENDHTRLMFFDMMELI